jgi:signal transduction histidine kinase
MRLKSFRAQMAVAAAASLAMLALTALLVRDVLASAERRLTEEARQQCLAAAAELKRQFEERAAYGGEALAALPPEAQDLSLRGLSHAVLRSYEGVEGGFFLDGRILGYSGDLPAPNMADRLQRGVSISQDGLDAIVLSTQPLGAANQLAWAARRVTGASDPAGMKRRVSLFGLALAALFGTVALVSMWLNLRRGVAGVKSGLGRVAHDLHARLPETRDDFGEIARAVNDMAARRAVLETELRRQDRLAALGRVVAGVAHEIRNPLNSMRLTLELLQRRLEKGRAASGEAEAAIREVDRLDAILARLLAFGRPPLQDRHPQSVEPVLRQALAIVQEQARQRDVRLVCECPSLEADIDAPQIGQVVVNLLLNAVEAAPDGSEVRVSAGVADGMVRVAVRNDGMPIPPEVQPHVFDAFFTTKGHGTGLGLAISREIVENHGGQLAMTPDGHGTTFVFTLPGSRA